ncbi:hypothetical protein ES705_32431 [subsurface metagenome]
MKRRGIFFFILPLLVLSGTYYGISQDLEPEEPEIVLPSIILEIEDLSIESVTAALPEEEELLAPELRFPLPEAGELEVAEPQMDFTIPEIGASVYQVKEGKYLTAEAVLGTGTSNQFYSRISLYFLGEKPEGKILYHHETVDGFSSKSPGSGYNMREDRVESFLNFNLWDIDLRTEGAFNDRERGLQGNGDFYSKINRFINAGLEGEYRLNDRFILKGSFEASSANQLLTEGITGTEEVTEYYISPSFGGEFQFTRGLFGILPSFSYRSIPEYPELSLGRSLVQGYFGVDLSEVYRLDGTLGWFWSEKSGHLPPFDLTLSALISDFLSLSIGGGYRILEYNLVDIFKKYPLGDIPSTLEDNHGWFFDVRSNWIPFQGWIIDAGLFYMNNSSMPNFLKKENPITGLFPFYQVPAHRISVDIGARWIISDSFSARAGLESEFGKRPAFCPKHRITLDMNMIEKEGKYGGGAALDFATGVNNILQATLLDLSGFLPAE